MIIILLFKACWYNQYLKMALAAGQPISRCPADTAAGMSGAQSDLWTFFQQQTYDQWKRTFTQYYRYGVETVDGKLKSCTHAAPCTGTANKIATYTTNAEFLKSTDVVTVVNEYW
jgi:hypothetical protein